MRIQLISDVHVEFHQDRGADFIRNLEPAGVDVLVVAGDLDLRAGLARTLRLLCDRYPHVVFVVGNHEYYRSSPEEVHDTLAAAAAKLPNLHWLHDRAVTLDGVTFAGAPLWFRETAVTRRQRHWLSDFHVIKDFDPWVYAENAQSVRFLEQVVGRADVVVTHHLPSHRSVSPQFIGSALNAFFVCDVEAIMHAGRPPLWLHGHTHSSCDYRIGDTRVLCNPFGYAHALNAGYIDRLVVEVAPRPVRWTVGRDDGGPIPEGTAVFDQGDPPPEGWTWDHCPEDDEDVDCTGCQGWGIECAARWRAPIELPSEDGDEE